MTPEPFLEQIAAWPVSEFVRTWPLAYPLLEILHVIGLALVFGGIFLFDLRLLGIGKSLPLSALSRHILPWVWTGLVVSASSGLLLFASDAAEFGANIAFRIKIVLLLLAGLNAFLFQWRVFPSLKGKADTEPIPAAARAAAMISILLWLSVIAAGRMIAYAP